MSYLDSKEKVLDLQLTPYGKFLLSIGKLKPVYYAYFDDDIIYNSTKAEIVNEGQSLIEPRIQEETPRFSAQTTVDGIETDFVTRKETFETIEAIADTFAGIDNLSEEETLEFFKRIPEPAIKTLRDQPIGRYKNSSGYAPAWNASFLKSRLSSSSDFLEISGSKGKSFYNIPQLNVDIRYTNQRNSSAFNSKFIPEVFVDEYDPDELGFMAKKLGLKDEISFLRFKNGSSIFTVKDFVAIRLEESNTNFEKQNFEVEFYEVYEDSEGEEQLIKRKFYKDYSQFAEDSINSSIGADKTSVENDFNLFFDGDIDPEVMCPLIVKDKTKQFYNKKIFNCEDLIEKQIADNIYTDVDDTGDVCD